MIWIDFDNILAENNLIHAKQPAAGEFFRIVTVFWTNFVHSL